MLTRCMSFLTGFVVTTVILYALWPSDNLEMFWFAKLFGIEK